MPAPSGLFITFEGIDGCGKTTQVVRILERLRALGHDPVHAVEPGGTRIGQTIREILLDSACQDLTARAELLLYFASRAQNVEEIIRPALQEGRIVLCDRFTDSTLAYQGYGRGLGPEVVLTLDRIACQGLKPDLTILLDIEPGMALSRARERGSNRMDEESAEFYERTRRGFLTIAGDHPERVILLDAGGSVEDVARRVEETVLARVDRATASGEIRSAMS